LKRRYGMVITLFEPTLELSIVAAFVAGLASFLTPCVVPLIPTYLSLITGLTLNELLGQEGEGTDSSHYRSVQVRAIVGGVGFVIGFALVFTALGATASLFGQALATYGDYLRIVGGIVLMVMGLHMVGIVQLPWLMRDYHIPREDDAHTGAGGASGRRLLPVMLSAVPVGMGFAAGWTPCFGPILASILLYAGAAGTAATGALYLLVYSLGIGLPLLLVAAFFTSFLRFLPRVGRWLGTIQVVAGVLLIVVGALLLFDRLGLIDRLF